MREEREGGESFSGTSTVYRTQEKAVQKELLLLLKRAGLCPSAGKEMRWPAASQPPMPHAVSRPTHAPTSGRQSPRPFPLLQHGVAGLLGGRCPDTY